MADGLLVKLWTENRKLTDKKSKPVAATYRRVGGTCPQECSFLNKGCYAQKGPTNIQQRRSETLSGELDAIAKTDIKLVRHHVSGDFFKADELDIEYLETVINFHKNNPDIQGWTYTHRWRSFRGAGYKPDAFPKNLTIIASCDSIEDADEAKKYGWRTARVTHDRLERRSGEAICRYQLDETKCSNCKLCWTTDKRVEGIMFLKH